MNSRRVVILIALLGVLHNVLRAHRLHPGCSLGLFQLPASVSLEASAF